MRLLVLGGTQSPGRAIAAHAAGLGHAVTCAPAVRPGRRRPGSGSSRSTRDRPDGLAARAGP